MFWLRNKKIIFRYALLSGGLWVMLSKLTFSKKQSGTPSERQTVWIQIRTDILSVLIWVQTVCKGYQQMTIVAASKLKASQSQNVILICGG